jgi:hypothetical protein
MRFHLVKEAVHHLAERLRLLGEAQVRRVLDDLQPRAGDARLHVGQVRGPALVVPPADQQRGGADRAE